MTESTYNLLRFADDLLNSVSAGIVMIDKELRYRFWGKTIEKMTGLLQSEMIGSFAPDLCPFIWDGHENENLLNALNDKISRSSGEYAVPQTSRHGYFDVHYFPFKNEKSEIVGAVAVIIDASLQKAVDQKLQETETRFKNMADSSPVLLWMAGTDGLCNFFNQTWLDFTGRTLEQEWGVGWAEAIHHEDFQSSIDIYMEHFNARTAFEMEYRLLRKDGQYRWILDRGAPRYLPDRSFAGFIGSCIDITDRKTAEQELIEAKRTADAANLAKSNFLAIVSHEIRTPLGAVLGFSELLTAGNESPSDRLNWINSIKRNGALLSNIINSILDLSKIEAGKIQIEFSAIFISDLLEEISSLMEFQASEKGLEFAIHVQEPLPSKIITDPLRLKQILVNVIGNAIKFTSHGSVNVTVRSNDPTSSGDYRIIFDVTDTGEGLGSGKLKQIFEPFTQADESTTRKHGGTGLGLTLARELARFLGGEVSLLHTAIGKGSAFRVEIVAKKAPASAELSKKSPRQVGGDRQQDLSRMRILLVDDSKDNQILVSHILKGAGALIETADNGELGVQKAMKGDYQVILMDIQMPVKDGYEALTDLKKAGFSRPVIALTAFALAQDRTKLLGHGFSEHLGKPIDKNKLLEVLTQFNFQK